MNLFCYILIIFSVLSCKNSTEQTSVVSEVVSSKKIDSTINLFDLKEPRELRPWHFYYGKFQADTLQTLRNDALKKTLHHILDSVHCVHRAALRPDSFVTSPVKEEDYYNYTKWLDIARSTCDREHPNSEAEMHRSLGYGFRERVNPRDHPEIRNARFYLFHDPLLGHIRKNTSELYLIEVFEGMVFGQQAAVGHKEGRPPLSEAVVTGHIWPKSRFRSGRKGHSLYREQLSDLHHLMPVSATLDKLRKGRAFAEILIKGAKMKDDSKAQIGPFDPSLIERGLTDFDPEKLYFEPTRRKRGDIARAMFYFAVRYQLKIDPVEEFFLKKWHEDDPVDEDEKRRNRTIARLQKTRNPFVDFPTLVNFIEDF